jgi:hypothetical protein
MKLAQFKKHKTSIDHWALKKKKALGMNKATVALAHKTARIGFAVLRDEKEFSSMSPKAS